MYRFHGTEDLKRFVIEVTNSNHRNLGKWTTAQIFYHLRAAFEASIQAEALPPGYPILVRWMVRPFRWIVTSIRFPRCLPIPAAIEFKLKPPLTAELQQEFQGLMNAIDQFDKFSGPFPPHPVLGTLKPAEWLGFHLRHCEHHLSFIQMNPGKGGSRFSSVARWEK